MKINYFFCILLFFKPKILCLQYKYYLKKEIDYIPSSKVYFLYYKNKKIKFYEYLKLYKIFIKIHLIMNLIITL